MSKKKVLTFENVKQLEDGGIYAVQVSEEGLLDSSVETLTEWCKVVKERTGKTLSFLVMGPDVTFLAPKKLTKMKDPYAFSTKPSQGKKSRMVINVDGEIVLRGSEKDDRWGPYGTEVRKKRVRCRTK